MGPLQSDAENHARWTEPLVPRSVAESRPRNEGARASNHVTSHASRIGVEPPVLASHPSKTKEE